MRYTACKTLCYHWDSRLDKKERTQEFSIRFAAMKESDADLKMYIPFEKNFSWWKVWFVYKTSKKIFRCQCQKEMIEWRIGNKHTPERDRRSRSVYIFLLLRYGPDFLTELFSKNVTFCARVCPPLGAGEKVLWKPRGESLQYFWDFPSFFQYLQMRSLDPSKNGRLKTYNSNCIISFVFPHKMKLYWKTN